MSWRIQTVTDERDQFALEASKSIRSFAETCRRFGISRPTGHKWIERYQADGVLGMADQSRRPHCCSHAIAQSVVDRIPELRRQFDLGARKIQRFLREEFDTVPCVDTIHDILKCHGCVERRKPRRRASHPGPPPISWTTPMTSGPPTDLGTDANLGRPVHSRHSCCAAWPRARWGGSETRSTGFYPSTDHERHQGVALAKGELQACGPVMVFDRRPLRCCCIVVDRASRNDRRKIGKLACSDSVLRFAVGNLHEPDRAQRHCDHGCYR